MQWSTPCVAPTYLVYCTLDLEDVASGPYVEWVLLDNNKRGNMLNVRFNRYQRNPDNLIIHGSGKFENCIKRFVESM